MGQEESTLAYDESVPEVQNLKVSEPAKLGEILKHEDVLLDKGKHRNENEQNLPGDGDPEAPREDSPAPAKTGDGADSEPTSPPPYDPEEDLAPTRGSLFWEYLPANPFRTAASEGAQPASSSCSALTAADMVEGVEAKAVMAALTSAMRELDAGLDDAKQAASKGRERHAAQLATYAEKNQVLANAIEQAKARIRAADDELSTLASHADMMERQLRIVNNWVDDWVAPVKPVQSQQAWLHQMEQEAMLDDDNDYWEDKAEQRTKS